MHVSAEIVDKPLHVIRDVELVHLVQHGGVTNGVEGFTKIESNDSDIRVIANIDVIIVYRMDDGGGSGSSVSESELIFKC